MSRLSSLEGRGSCATYGIAGCNRHYAFRHAPHTGLASLVGDGMVIQSTSRQRYPLHIQRSISQLGGLREWVGTRLSRAALQPLQTTSTMQRCKLMQAFRGRESGESGACNSDESTSPFFDQEQFHWAHKQQKRMVQSCIFLQYPRRILQIPGDPAVPARLQIQRSPSV